MLVDNDIKKSVKLHLENSINNNRGIHKTPKMREQQSYIERWKYAIY